MRVKGRIGAALHPGSWIGRDDNHTINFDEKNHCGLLGRRRELKGPLKRRDFLLACRPHSKPIASGANWISVGRQRGKVQSQIVVGADYRSLRTSRRLESERWPSIDVQRKHLISLPV
jgi:hypothetical protein